MVLLFSIFLQMINFELAYIATGNGYITDSNTQILEVIIDICCLSPILAYFKVFMKKPSVGFIYGAMVLCFINCVLSVVFIYTVDLFSAMQWLIPVRYFVNFSLFFFYGVLVLHAKDKKILAVFQRKNLR